MPVPALATAASWRRRSGEPAAGAPPPDATSDLCRVPSPSSWDIPRTFSSCSTSSYEKFLVERGAACLLDRPDYRDLQAPAVCGNGFVEQGEQCDCGTVQVNIYTQEAEAAGSRGERSESRSVKSGNIYKI